MFELPRTRPAGDLFTEDADWWHNAVLQRAGASWAVYADGYRLAADAAIEAAQLDRSTLDFLIYPILFLYRQYLEISLKEILLYAEELRDGDLDVPRTHNLDSLWKRCQSAVKAVDDGAFVDEIDVIDDTVEQFSMLDPTSSTFRYPVDTEGYPVKYLVDRVNIRSLRQEMDNAALAIFMISGGLSALVDQKREFQGEWGP